WVRQSSRAVSGWRARGTPQPHTPDMQRRRPRGPGGASLDARLNTYLCSIQIDGAAAAFGRERSDVRFGWSDMTQRWSTALRAYTRAVGAGRRLMFAATAAGLSLLAAACGVPTPQ